MFQRTGHSSRPGAGETVRSLRRTFRLGLLTNRPPDVHRINLAGCGLDDKFDAVVISGEIGYRKPDSAARWTTGSGTTLRREGHFVGCRPTAHCGSGEPPRTAAPDGHP